MLRTRQMRQITQITRRLVGVRAVENEFECIALPALVSALQRLDKMGLLLADARFSCFCLLRQVLQIARVR